MSDLSFRLGIKPASPALEGRFLTTGPQRKSLESGSEGCGKDQIKLMLDWLPWGTGTGRAPSALSRVGDHQTKYSPYMDWARVPGQTLPCRNLPSRTERKFSEYQVKKRCSNRPKTGMQDDRCILKGLRFCRAPGSCSSCESRPLVSG